MTLFMLLWTLLVYFPMAHMVWGKGGLLNAFLGGKFPCFDFAGGTVGTLIILKICDITVGLRVTKEQETEGLDLSLHGEEGYILES